MLYDFLFALPAIKFSKQIINSCNPLNLHFFSVLALKQISKPIANVLKTRAKSSPFFRKYICMPPAQFYNYMEVKMKMLALNLGKPTAVPKLTEAMAIELGANLLGETIIFAIGAGLLM